MGSISSSARSILLGTLTVALLTGLTWLNLARAQDSGGEDAATGPTAEAPAEDGAAGDAAAPKSTEELMAEAARELNLLQLLYDGGALMIPIGLLSIVIVTFGVERAIALRRNKICPDELVEALGEMGERTGRFDPREAYRICQRIPCSASSVIRRILLKVGRPLPEIEHAATEAAEREATRLYSNVRPIVLSVAIAPLLGLLGTVWGMILAFFITSQLPVGSNKAQQLAEGIYVALVTTLAGLAVAIPGACLAHYFEGRIQNLFHDIDDLVQSLLPQLERYEGKMRVRRKKKDGTEEEVDTGTELDDSPLPRPESAASPK